MRGLYVALVFTHVLAAIVWLGGTLFFALVLAPVMRRPENRAAAPALVHATGLRFRTVGWTSIGVLMTTGVLILGMRGYRVSHLFDGTLFSGPFGHVLAAKLLLVALIVAVSAYHDFVAGVRATRAWAADPESSEALRHRRLAGRLGRLTALLSLGVVALAVMLARGASLG